MPHDAEWYLVVIEGEEVTRRVGMGWRKWHSDGNPNGWWETNFGLTRQEYITHWMPRPALPPKRKKANMAAQAAPLGFRWVRRGEWPMRQRATRSPIAAASTKAEACS